MAQSTGDEAANSLSGQPSLVLPSDAQAEGNLNGFVIAGGPANAPGFGLAGALCTAYNVQVDPDMPVCLVRATTGSAENLALMTEGRADFAVVQSDRQYFAFSGQADNAGGDAIEDLRAVFSFAVLPIHVLASATSPAEGLGDLTGGRVGLGPLDPRSGCWRRRRSCLRRAGIADGPGPRGLARFADRGAVRQ